jgi:colanic acid/amylovoran biosynthesis glycosyltransferase
LEKSTRNRRDSEQFSSFLAPSVTAADGNQDAPVNTLKEAMAMGLPVISTYHGGIPELVEDGVSGFLVPERDAKAIAQKLDYLISHPEIWVQMGRSGRRQVEDKYDMEKLNDELVKIYQNSLSLEIPNRVDGLWNSASTPLESMAEVQQGTITNQQ